MPLRYAQKNANHYLMGIWDTQEDESWFLNRLTLHPDEIEALPTLHPSRRRDWLSTRYLVHLLSGHTERIPCLKDTFGRPYFKDLATHISISHSGGLAAVILTGKHGGIDIQKWDARLKKLGSKFLTDEELASIPAHTELESLHVLWGAKEALYKAHGLRRLNFKHHITCDPFQYHPNGGEIIGYLLENDGQKKAYAVRYRPFEDAMLVWATDVL